MAWSRLRPSSIITCRSTSAIPIPAVPAPWITTVWSRIAVPAARVAHSAAASTTAAVPWMSSLKVQEVPAYLCRMRRALAAPKSSQCSIARGKSGWQC